MVVVVVCVCVCVWGWAVGGGGSEEGGVGFKRIRLTEKNRAQSHVEGSEAAYSQSLAGMFMVLWKIGIQGHGGGLPGGHKRFVAKKTDLTE